MRAFRARVLRSPRLCRSYAGGAFYQPDPCFGVTMRGCLAQILLKAKELFKGTMLLMGGGKLEGTHRLVVDRKDAVFKTVKHLANLGHRRIAFVGAATDQLVGFTLGLLDFKLEYKEDSIIYYSSPAASPRSN